MKINPIELQQIIKEEALRLKKRMMLESERDSIVKKLQALEECESMEENIDEGIFSKKDPAVVRQGFADLIKRHPAYSKTSAFIAQKYNEDVNYVFEKLVDIFVQNGGVPTGGVAWDTAKRIFVDKTKYTGTAPGMQGAAE